MRGATAEALGYIATLLRADQFSAAAVKLLQLHVGLLRNESSDPTTRIAIARGICQVLRRCASPAGQSVLAESATNLMGALHPMVGAAPDYASPSSAKAHAELLRAFEIITTGFPSTTVRWVVSARRHGTCPHAHHRHTPSPPPPDGPPGARRSSSWPRGWRRRSRPPAW